MSVDIIRQPRPTASLRTLAGGALGSMDLSGTGVPAPGMGSTPIGLIFSVIPVILQDDALFTQDRLQSPASENDELPSLRGLFQGLSEYRTKTSNPPAFIWGGGGRLTGRSTAMDTVC